MKYTEFRMKNFSELTGVVSKSDVCGMELYDYAIGLHIVISSTKAFRAALLKCSVNPNNMKGCEEREDFLEYAETEAIAGAQLLELFMEDKRFDIVEKALRANTKSFRASLGWWDDFMRFSEFGSSKGDKQKGAPSGEESDTGENKG